MQLLGNLVLTLERRSLNVPTLIIYIRNSLVVKVNMEELQGTYMWT